MNYDYYRVFLAVGKRGSFTRAAEELYTSQPAVTRTIKNLESELGVRLFVRGKKGVEFTPEGTVLFKGRGWGHGVGLCQCGAAVMALSSCRYKDILNHYYPGSELAECPENLVADERLL